MLQIHCIDDGFGKLCQMHLVSMIYHQQYVKSLPTNHVVHTTSHICPTGLDYHENLDEDSVDIRTRSIRNIEST